MAKDGTLRGSAPAISKGRKRKSAIEKQESGNPGHRPITVLDIPDNLETAELEGVDVPPIEEYLTANQRDGKPFKAKEIFEKTYSWLQSLHVEKAVNIQLLNQYSMSVARWIQCEEMISQTGFLAKHPTTNAPMTSPYVSMAQSYMKQSNIEWMQIYQVVKENCTVDFRGPNPNDDAMEMLLRARGQ
jgi:hypothetical protein